ncbi:hypothetical protein H6A03_00925 [[Clostridium] spiroforme]|nr:hypothetical protein [Thomasclavelia spiroformis]
MKNIEIKDGREKTYHHRYYLHQMGMSFKKTGKYSGMWHKKTDNSAEIEILKNYCIAHHLNIKIYDDSDKRSHDYRSSFFQTNLGLFNKGRYYHCAYCGRILKKNDIQVDHIFPVYMVKDSNFTNFNKKVLKLFHITNINCTRNLVASCKKCNQQKGNKTGLWIFRAWIGKYFLFWIIFYAFILLAVLKAVTDLLPFFL